MNKSEQRKIDGLVNGTTRQAAVAETVAYLTSAATRGQRVSIQSTDDSVHMDVDRAWTVGCMLYVRFRHDWDPDTNHVAEDGTRYVPVKVAVELNWSATSRDLHSAQGCIDLYAHLALLGREVELLFADRQVVVVIPATRPGAVAS